MTDLIDEVMGLPSLEGYSARDQYADFNHVLLQDEQGRRVLKQILSWCRMFRSPVFGEPVDMGRMAIATGERNVGLKLLATVYNEPPEPPVKQVQERVKRHG